MVINITQNGLQTHVQMTPDELINLWSEGFRDHIFFLWLIFFGFMLFTMFKEKIMSKADEATKKTINDIYIIYEIVALIASCYYVFLYIYYGYW